MISEPSKLKLDGSWYVILQQIESYKCIECGGTNVVLARDSLQPRTIKICRNCHTQDKETETKIHCPECHGTELEYDRYHAELYCQKCGIVLGGPPPYYVGGYHKIQLGWYKTIKAQKW